RERLAVLIVCDGDPNLSENLTEVAISTLAEYRNYDLVGSHELRPPLGEILGGEGIASCLGHPACLAQIGAAAGATRAVIGDVRRTEDQFAVHVTLTETGTGRSEAESSRDVPMQMDRLIAAVQTAVSELSRPRVAPAERSTSRDLKQLTAMAP